MSTYFKELRDSLTTEHHHVPFIYRPPELVMECKFHGPIEMYQLAKQSIRNHLSLIPEYQCRLCEDQIPHEFSEGHLQYSSTYSLNDGIDLLSEHIYGCCESCSKKISSREIERDGSEVKDPKGPIPTNEELESISLGSIVDSVIKDDE